MARTAADICKEYNRNRQIRQGVIELTDGNMKQNIDELFEVDATRAKEFCIALSKDIGADPAEFFETGRVRSMRA